ncbi:MAG: GWxTD domain-containing protein [Candidatus Eisenbacteria bacterium]|nr:GWxTD domain-containing protein [Candidatus Eisenbacteria bacterium]
MLSVNKIVSAIALTLLVSPSAFLPPAYTQEEYVSVGHPLFSADVFSFWQKGSGNVVEVSYEVENRELKFVKSEAGFEAAFDISVVFYDTKGRQVKGQIWRRKVVSDKYSETVSSELSFSEVFTFSIPAGKYVLVVKTKNLNSGQTAEVRADISMQDYGSSSPTMSDLKLGTCSSEDRSEARRSVKSGRRFGEAESILCIYGELYGTPPGRGDSSFTVAYAVYDDEGNEKDSGRTLARAEGRVTPFLLRISTSKYLFGEYYVRVSAEGRGSGKRIRKEARFEMDESKVSLDEDFEDILDLLRYISSNEEISKLEELKGQERKEYWMQFWRRRDPYPETARNEFMVEFFKRARYADKKFGSVERGSKTDRGRVYIMLGEPHQIEAQPMSMNSPAYEIWYYFAPSRKFVFVDRLGFGNYELLSQAGG